MPFAILIGSEAVIFRYAIVEIRGRDKFKARKKVNYVVRWNTDW